MSNAKVYLVGAGPGDAGLITARGLELLKTADCVIFDKLANPVLLKHAKAGAEIIYAGKRAGAHSYKQAQINELIIEKAKQGKMVVRLKGGDPCIFGRGAEEALELVGAGIEFEIVPGITAAIGAAEYAGIMLTHRDYASSVAFITGHEAEGKADSNINWEVLANFGGTLVFYMGMSNLEMICGELCAHGMDSNMPAAVIANATLPSQRIVTASLSEILNACLDAEIGPPALIIIGPAARVDSRLQWFTKKTLFGQKILITRDAHGNADFACMLNQQGAEVVEYAGIEFEGLTDSQEFINAIANINEYEWSAFTSSNGVQFVFDAVERLGKDVRVFGNVKIAVIGEKTAKKLKSFGIRADFMPSVYTGTELGKQLAGHAQLKGKKVLLLRSAIAGSELSEELKKAGAVVNDVPVYTTVARNDDNSEIIEALAAGKIDWITFTSSSTVRSFFEHISVDKVRSNTAKIASIGPMASAALSGLGVPIHLEAATHTTEGLVDAICKFTQHKSVQ